MEGWSKVATAYFYREKEYQCISVGLKVSVDARRIHIPGVREGVQKTRLFRGYVPYQMGGGATPLTLKKPRLFSDI